MNYHCASDWTEVWLTTQLGTPIGKVITDDNSYMLYKRVWWVLWVWEHFRIYLTLHVQCERISEQCKYKLSIWLQYTIFHDVNFMILGNLTHIYDAKHKPPSTIYVQNHCKSGGVESGLYLLNPGLWAAVGELVRWEHLSACGTCEEAGNRVGLGPCINLWKFITRLQQ